MNLEFQKFRKAVENRLNTLDNKINNLSIEDILDNHVQKFQSKVKDIEAKKADKIAEVATLKEEKVRVDAIRENNKAIKKQIEEIKAKALSIDVRAIGDTQRFIEELRKDVVAYNKEKYDQVVHEIGKLEAAAQQDNADLDVFNSKIAKFEGVKEALKLNDVDYE